jgi:plasmid stabilization system protein ParE
VKGLLHYAADEEFEEAVKYYTQIDPALGVRFYREVERLIKEVCENPERFWQFDPPARRHISFEFPYAVIYLRKPDYVWIVAVMHMKQQPGYWRERVD